MSGDTMIHHVAWVRGRKDTRIGTLVAKKCSDGKVCIGWSKRHDTQEPRPFLRNVGTHIAAGRAAKQEPIRRIKAKTTAHMKHCGGDGTVLISDKRTLPYDMHCDITDFVGRAKRFFRVDSIANYTDEVA